MTAKKKTARPTPAQTRAAADRAEGVTVDQQATAKINLENARLLYEEMQAAAVAAGISVPTAPAVHIEKTHSASVWVACKLPNGLLLQLHEKATMDMPVIGGGIKQRPVFMRTGEPVRLKGAAVPFGAIPKHTIEGGFALTEVKRDFWETWYEQNKSLDLVKNGLVFCHSEKESAISESAEKAKDFFSGLEPLNPDGDYRVEKSLTPNLTEIGIDNERDAYKQMA